MERVTRAVDDGLQQLVPGPGSGREPRDLVDEAELVELIRLAPAARGIGRAPVRATLPTLVHARPLLHHVHHLTRVGTEQPTGGCGGVPPGLRYRAVLSSSVWVST